MSPDRSLVVRDAIRQAVSVSIATGLYGMSFGALSIAAGLDLPQTAALSLLMFSGGSQFAFIGVIGPGGAVAAVATAGLLGTRNGLYGPQVAPLLGARGWRRPVAAQLTIDESTAVAAAQRDPAASRAARLGTRTARTAAALAIVVALGLTPFVPAGLPVLAAAAVAIVLGWSRPAVVVGRAA